MKHGVVLVGALLAFAGSAPAAHARCVHVGVKHHGERCLSRAVLRGVPPSRLSSAAAMLYAWRRADPAADAIHRLPRVSRRAKRRLIRLLARHRRAIVRPAGAARDWVEPGAPNPKGGAAGLTTHEEQTVDSAPPLRTRTRVRRTTEHYAAWNCPDADGNATGTVRHREVVLVRVTDLRTGRLILHQRTDAGYAGRFEAHVGDDALLRDYDLTVNVHNGPHRAQFVFRGVQPHRPWAIEDRSSSRPHIRWGGATGQDSTPWDVDGPTAKSIVLGQIPVDLDATGELFALAGAARYHADDAVVVAFTTWFEFADCVRVTYDPPGGKPFPGNPPLRLPVGRPTAVTITVHSRRDDGLVKGAVSNTSDIAAVSPPSAALPAHVILVAERLRDERPYLATEGVSRRGRIVGALVLKPYAAIPRTFAGTISGHVVTTSESGTASEDWAITGVRFDRVPGRFAYTLAAGTVHWSSTSSMPAIDCTSSGTGTFPAAGAGAVGQIVFGSRTDYRGGIWYPREGTVTTTCQGTTVTASGAVFGDGWDSNGNQGYLNHTDGGWRLAGSATDPVRGVSWEWSLDPVF